MDFRGLLPVKCRKVPFVGKFNALFGRAFILAISTKDAGIVSVSDLPDRLVSVDNIRLAQSLSRTDIYTRTASDTHISIKFRFTAIAFRGLVRLGWKTRSKSR